MIFSGLQHGILLRRRMRFLVDIELPEGVVTAHCPNTGSMKSLLHAGTIAYFSYSGNPGRRYPYTLEFLRLPQGAWAMVNTARANALVEESLVNGSWLKCLPEQIQKEVPLSSGSRMDFRIACDPPIWIEVKNVTLIEPQTPHCAQFPDAITQRGHKHLHELQQCVHRGDRALMLFLISRTDAHRFRPAVHIDRLYAQEFARSVEKGVEVAALRLHIEPRSADIIVAEAKDLVPWEIP